MQFDDHTTPDIGIQPDPRQWTQQHLDAADLRLTSIAPTPPRADTDTDCVDVNVLGPGEWPSHHITGSGLVSKQICKWMKSNPNNESINHEPWP